MSDTSGITLGSKIDGRYEVVAVIGFGGMGVVYKVRQQVGGVSRVWALKTILPRHATDAAILTRFREEAEKMCLLDHENIVSAIDYSEKGDLPYIVMPFVEGRSLRDYLVDYQRREGRTLPLSQVVDIALELVRGLEAAHGFVNPDTGRPQPIIHRDIKPANIMVRFDGQGGERRLRVFIMDFGIAKILGDEPTAHSLTDVVGTVRYASPEQIRRAKKIDARTDIYSLGMVLYEMYTGHHPLARMSDRDLILRMTGMEVEPEELDLQFPGDTPELFRELILRCVAIDRRKRFASVSELRPLLQQLREIDRQSLSSEVESLLTDMVRARSELEMEVGTGVRDLLSEGDRLVEQGKQAQGTGSLQEAVRLLRSAQGAYERAAVAKHRERLQALEARREKVAALREEAVQAGAETLAPVAFEQARRASEAADRVLENATRMITESADSALSTELFGEPDAVEAEVALDRAGNEWIEAAAEARSRAAERAAKAALPRAEGAVASLAKADARASEMPQAKQAKMMLARGVSLLENENQESALRALEEVPWLIEAAVKGAEQEIREENRKVLSGYLVEAELALAALSLPPKLRRSGRAARRILVRGREALDRGHLEEAEKVKSEFETAIAKLRAASVALEAGPSKEVGPRRRRAYAAIVGVFVAAAAAAVIGTFGRKAEIVPPVPASPTPQSPRVNDAAEPPADAAPNVGKPSPIAPAVPTLPGPAPKSPIQLGDIRPAERVVQVPYGSNQRFVAAVTAGDPSVLVWDLDGARRGTGPVLSLDSKVTRSPGIHRLALSSLEGGRPVRQREWEIEVFPKLELGSFEPSEATFERSAGEQVTFRAEPKRNRTAETVTHSWEVNGEARRGVAGAVLSLDPQRPGEYRVRAKISAPWGETVERAWKLTVRAVPTPGTSPQPPAPSAEQEVRAWVTRYCSAYDQKQPQRLLELGALKDQGEVAEVQQAMSKLSNLKVACSNQRVQVDGDVASVTFERVDEWTDRNGPQRQSRSLNLKLRLREGQWKLSRDDQSG